MEALENQVTPKNKEIKWIWWWLIVLIIVMFVHYITLYSQKNNYNEDYSDYSQGFRDLVTTENIIINTQLILIIIAWIAFSKKSKYFPKILIWYFLFGLIYIVYFAYVSKNIIELSDYSITEDIAWILWSIIWILYLLKSKRVKNTFIN